ALRAWYECLRDFLIANGFKVGKADPTLFTKTLENDLFICQIYVDDIIQALIMASNVDFPRGEYHISIVFPLDILSEDQRG
ncbi:hypothetical protein LCGC14_2966040, partial [marine sediment metagenome]